MFFPCKGFNCATRPEARRDKTKEFIIHFWVLKPIPLSLWAKYKFWFIKIDLLYLRKVEYHVTIEYKMVRKRKILKSDSLAPCPMKSHNTVRELQSNGITNWNTRTLLTKRYVSLARRCDKKWGDSTQNRISSPKVFHFLLYQRSSIGQDIYLLYRIRRWLSTCV